MSVNQLETDPVEIVTDLLLSEWNATGEVTVPFDAEAWTHTGWYSGNPNPEISVTWDGESVDTPTGYDGIDPGGGGPTRRPQGTVNVDVWVPGDEDWTGGENPKKYVYQLRREVERIVQANARGTTTDGGDRELEWLGVGRSRRVPEPDETPVEHRMRVPVEYGYLINYS